MSFGTGWAKSLSFTTGQCPLMKCNRQLMMAILHDKVPIARAVNAAKTIPTRRCPTQVRRIRLRSRNEVRAQPNGYVAA